MMPHVRRHPPVHPDDPGLHVAALGDTGRCVVAGVTRRVVWEEWRHGTCAHEVQVGTALEACCNDVLAVAHVEHVVFADDL